ncbi:MAG TPA: VOC family protein [Nocardioidaceae bacterium]|nr:VOC family protein [Nocardioidaceae bacterium]
MTFHLHKIAVDCRDWHPLVEFWTAASDFAEIPNDPNNPDDEIGGLMDPSTGVQLLFIPVPEPKTIKNRIHFDVQPVDGTRDQEVERLQSLGATIVDDRRNADGTGWVVMGDPEGNEFCVERSASERVS